MIYILENKHLNSFFMLIKDSLRYYILSFFAFVLLLLLYYPFFLELIKYWRSDPEFHYGFLIPIISFYLIWIKRKEIKYSLVNGSPSIIVQLIGFVFLILGLIIFIAGKYTSVLAVEGFSLIIIILAAILFIVGIDTFRLFIYPMLYLTFMLPLPYFVIYHLSKIFIKFHSNTATYIISSIGIPVYLEGNIMNLSNDSFSVQDTCSGMRTLISFIAISTPFAYLYINAMKFKILLILASIPIAILINLLRITLIGIISYYIGSGAAHTFHMYAWIFVTPLGVISISSVWTLLRCLESRSGY